MCECQQIVVVLETGAPANVMELIGGSVGLTIRTVFSVARANIGEGSAWTVEVIENLLIAEQLGRQVRGQWQQSSRMIRRR